MGMQPRSWWQKIKQHWVAIAVGAIVLVGVIVLIVVGYRFDWTGFNGGYSQITTTSTSRGNTTATVKPPGKTLWDWLNLLGVLAIPVAVGLGVAWFTAKFNEQQSRTEHEIASDNQREAALQAYIDKISDLLLKEHLGELTPEGKLKPEYEGVRKIARMRTLTVLFRLDNVRKRDALQFLYESGLIDKGMRIIDLSGADLREAIPSEAKLSRANLSGANLREAKLDRADLRETELSRANLWNAELNGAELNGADLTEADLTEAHLILAKLSGAKLSRANLWDADLSGANLSGAKLISGITVTYYGRSYYVSGPMLEGANLSGANLREARLIGAILWSVDLSGADLWKANLQRAYLSRANLTEADLSGAKQTEDTIIKYNGKSFQTSGNYSGGGANLSRAKLKGANLTEANLSGVDLTGADLTGVVATQEQLDTAKSLRGATMPDGSKHP